MAVIETSNPEVARWRGLHLFHYSLSNCSRRVRIYLEEKGLSWTSHHLDLARNQHASDWFQSINPLGLVPTLVHDGTVVVDSLDILAYLESAFPYPVLAAHDTAGLSALADARQADIKLLSHEYLFKPVRRMGRADLQRLRAKLRNQAVLDFHERFRSGFPLAELQAAVDNLHDALAALQNGLRKAGPWLAGKHFSSLDLTWAVNVHRLSRMRFPMRDYPEVREWMQRVRARPSYGRALVAWEPAYVRLYYALYGGWRRLTSARYLERSRGAVRDDTRN